MKVNFLVDCVVFVFVWLCLLSKSREVSEVYNFNCRFFISVSENPISDRYFYGFFIMYFRVLFVRYTIPNLQGGFKYITVELLGVTKS